MSKGYTDRLPIERLSESGGDKILGHPVRGPRGGEAQAKWDRLWKRYRRFGLRSLLGI